MYEILYIEGIPWRLENNVRLGGWANATASKPDDNTPTDSAPYQLDPNDDDMSRLQEIAPDDYMDYRRPERDTQEVVRPRPNMEPNYREIDYYNELRYSESTDPGLVWPERYGWDQFDVGYYY